MKYLQINRLGFRQYECINENGKIVKSGIGEDIESAIKNCMEEEFYAGLIYDSRVIDYPSTNKTIPFQINIENGTHYIGSRNTEWYKINIGDRIVMDISKDIYIAQVNMKPTTQHVSV